MDKKVTFAEPEVPPKKDQPQAGEECELTPRPSPPREEEDRQDPGSKETPQGASPEQRGDKEEEEEEFAMAVEPAALTIDHEQVLRLCTIMAKVLEWRQEGRYPDLWEMEETCKFILRESAEAEDGFRCLGITVTAN